MNMSDNAAVHRGPSPPIARDHSRVVNQPSPVRARPRNVTAEGEDVVLRYGHAPQTIRPKAVKDEDDDPIGYDWEALAEFQ
jgi:hypothetical protein